MTRAPRTLLIVGGGTAGWMTAAALARFLPAGWRIDLIESDAISTIGVGEATIPQIHHFNAALGIDEGEFLAATQATFKLGITFEGWHAPGNRYAHAFGQVGRPLGPLPFHQYWLAAKTGEDSLDAYSIGAMAGYAGRFARPDPRRPALAGGQAYAYHFDASLYAAFLRTRAEASGVTRHEGRIATVERDGESGDILAVSTDDGRRLAADLFIDCTGFAALLIGRELGVGHDDWRQWLPCDRALAVPCAHGEAPRPYTRSIARAAGWQWQIPTQRRVGNGLVYASEAIGDDEAAATLLANLPGEALAEPRALRFAAGRRQQVWAHNVFAIGLSSGFLEPLESTSIHLIQSGIERLIQRLPAAHPGEAERRAFNEDAAIEMERVRDFIILHYWANGREEPFWAERRATPVPDSLAERVALFRDSGRVEARHRDLFTDMAWQQVLIGQGIMPAAAHPLTAVLSDAELAEFLTLTRRSVSQSVAAMPPHTASLPASDGVAA